MALALNDRTTRLILVGNQWMQWISALIVMSLCAYFISKFTADEHLKYEITISTINVAFFIPALFLPLFSSYKGYLLPLSFIFSYLWLTAFIFEAQDYDEHTCALDAPDTGSGFCGRKRTMEAFSFLAFFFNLTGTIIEAHLVGAGLFGARNVAAATEKTNGHQNGNQAAVTV